MVRLADQDAGQRGGAPAVPRRLRAADLGARADRARPEAAQARRRRLGVHRARLGRAAQRRHRPRPEDRGAARAAPAAREQTAWVRQVVLAEARVIFEVFRQERKGQAFQHAGSVAAPDDALRRAVRARAVRPARRVGGALGRPARRDPRGRGLRRRAGPQLPPRRRLLAEGEAGRRGRVHGSGRQLLLELADDELVLGWRDSEWTGIAPVARGGRRVLVDRAERDRPRARALRARRARLGTTADELAFDREPGRVPLRAARRAAARARLGAHDRAALPLRDGRRRSGSSALKASDDAEVAGLAAKIDREEAYHRMHARDVGRPRCVGRGRASRRSASRELWPYALGVLAGAASWPSASRAASVELPEAEPVERGEHHDELRELWEEMTRCGARSRRARRGDAPTQVWEALAEIPDPEIPVDLARRPRRRPRRPRRRRARARRVHAHVPRLPGARGDARADGRARSRSSAPSRRSRSSSTTPGRPTGSRRRAARSCAPPASPRRPRGRPAARQLVQLQSERLPLPVLRLDATRGSRTSSARPRAARSATATQLPPAVRAVQDDLASAVKRRRAVMAVDRPFDAP